MCAQQWGSAGGTDGAWNGTCNMRATGKSSTHVRTGGDNSKDTHDWPSRGASCTFDGCSHAQAIPVMPHHMSHRMRKPTHRSLLPISLSKPPPSPAPLPPSLPLSAPLPAVRAASSSVNLSIRLSTVPFQPCSCLISVSLRRLFEGVDKVWVESLIHCQWTREVVGARGKGSEGACEGQGLTWWWH